MKPFDRDRVEVLIRFLQSEDRWRHIDPCMRRSDLMLGVGEDDSAWASLTNEVEPHLFNHTWDAVEYLVGGNLWLRTWARSEHDPKINPQQVPTLAAAYQGVLEYRALEFANEMVEADRKVALAALARARLERELDALK